MEQTISLETLLAMQALLNSHVEISGSGGHFPVRSLLIEKTTSAILFAEVGGEDRYLPVKKDEEGNHYLPWKTDLINTVPLNAIQKGEAEKVTEVQLEEIMKGYSKGEKRESLWSSEQSSDDDKHGVEKIIFAPNGSIRGVQCSKCKELHPAHLHTPYGDVNGFEALLEVVSYVKIEWHKTGLANR